MDFSLAEILLIAVVAVIFIGPKELPAVIRALAKAMKSLRGLYGDVKKTFDDLTEEAGLKDAADSVNAELRLIKGDDGKFYESYDLPHIAKNPKHGQ